MTTTSDSTATAPAEASVTPPSRAQRIVWTVGLVVVAVAIVACTALLVDYLKPEPAFCSEDGGCGLVKQTIFARPWGIPTPAFGLVGLAGIAWTLLVRGKTARLLGVLQCSLGGMVAAFLIWVQSKIGSYCPYCMTVDVSMLLLLCITSHRAATKWDPPATNEARWGIAGGLAFLFGVTGVYGSMHTLPLNPIIAQEIAATPKGKVTVIDFADFECPYCRLSHESLGPLLKKEAANVRVVRKQVPLTRIHPHAEVAAKAAVCGEAAGKGDAMADLLFAAPEDDLTVEGVTKLATSLGIDPATFATCLDAKSTADRIAADGQMFHDIGGRGLPLLYIDSHKLMGAQDDSTLEPMLKDAEKADGAGQ